MSAALHQTFADLSRVLVDASVGPTISDLLAWERSQSPRPYANLRQALDTYGMGQPEELLSKLKYRLTRQIARERKKAAMGRWDFCPLRFEAYAGMLEMVNRFEGRTI
jgi:hypothetical protein